MRFVVILMCLSFIDCFGAVDFGVGTSSVTGGRPVPSLAVGLEIDNWGMLLRSEGVQTTIYSQNAWTVAGYKTVFSEKFGIVGSSVNAGFGGAHILRTYRESLTSEIETTKEYVLGPHLAVKFQLGFLYLGFDTLLGLTKQITQHLTLNFQDVSHVTIGFTF
ncbi:MAG: hypothetical protein JNL11_19355 [Bdellovibrionaceae bacterium]|nr:hypothetical protein [Pseudobdellovibrionaceae bacterium]